MRTPSNTVTPDLIAQKLTKYGITAEVKKSLPQNQTLWERYIRQLLKYDDDLTGWWTDNGKIPKADAILLLHHSRSRAFCRFLRNIQEDEPDNVGRNTSVVEFGSSDETASYYFFRVEHGSLRDQELVGRLDDGVQIPLDKVLQSFPNVRFYDSPPPMAFLLTELWMGIFPAMLEGAEYDEKYKATKFSASVQGVTDELQKAYGSETLYRDEQSVQFPRLRWIKEAFEKLVEFKMAIPPTGDNDEYQILFRTLRGDILKRFIELVLSDRIAGEIPAPKKPISSRYLMKMKTRNDVKKLTCWRILHDPEVEIRGNLEATINR